MAGGRTAGYEYAADFLAASINQNTKTLRYTLSSDLSEKVEQDRLYEQAYEDMIKILDETSKVNKKTISGELEGSYRFKTGDLYLALNKVDIDYSATYDGEWVVTLRFSDTYNFEHNN
ncbi:MAG: hypothetical protein IKM20_10030 [Erysipelotrichales bacterium]|nr:hypothetical protein [Erysipelotrichales bacterium]